MPTEREKKGGKRKKHWKIFIEPVRQRITFCNLETKINKIGLGMKERWSLLLASDEEEKKKGLLELYVSHILQNGISGKLDRLSR